MRRTLKCGGCGASVFVDDEAQAISHDGTECEPFKQLIKAIPPSETREVSEEALDAHLAALAARVRAKKQ